MKIVGMVFCAFLFLLCGTNASSADTIEFANRSRSPVTIWLWDGDKSEWVHRMWLPSSQRKTLDIGKTRRGYVVARVGDQYRKDVVLGWFNFPELLNRSEFDAIVVDSAVVREAQERVYTICKPVWETKTRERIVYRKQCVDGVWRIVPETITEEYKVCHMVPEQRTRTAFVDKLLFSGNAWSATRTLTSDVTFSTASDGAFVRYRLAVRKEVVTLDNPTTTTQSIPVGTYLVWTERNDSSTSEGKWYDIFEKTRNITIEERPPSQ